MKWYFNQETELEAGKLELSWVIKREVGDVWFGTEVMNEEKLWKTAGTS